MKYLLILLTLFSLTANAQTSGKTLGGNYPSGSYGFRNYMLNPGGEIDAQNVSVAGTGGTIGVFSNNPITNKKSFRVGGNLNTNITGTFTAAPFDQGLGDSNNNCAAGFNLQPNGTGTYTMNIKVGSTTVATRSFTTTSGVPVQYQTFLFSCGAYGLTPTIDIIANLTSGSGTDHYQADDFYMGQDPGFIGSMAIRTQEAAYTPVYTGWGTVSTSNMKWYQDGGYLYIYGTFVSVSATGVEARISLPPGYTSSSTIATLELAGGTVGNGNATAGRRSFPLIEPNVTYMTFGFSDNTTNILNKTTGNAIATGTVTIAVSAKIPIAGASNVNAIPAFCINNPDCQNNFSAKVSSTGVVSDENYSFINGNCTMSSGLSACTWDTSRFSVAPNCTINASNTGSGTPRFFNISTTTSASSAELYNTSATGTNTQYTIQCSRAGTDVKPWGPIPLITGMVSADDPASVRASWVFFGTGTNGTTACSATPCTVYFQIGTNLTSVVWEAAGIYRLMGIDGTKSTCMGTGLGGGVPITFIMDKDNSTTTYARMLARNPSGTATNSAYNSVNCGEKR